MPIGVFIRTKQHREKTSKTLMGHPVFNKVRRKISETLEGKYLGKNGTAWKNGITYNKKRLSWLKNKRNRMKRSNGGSHTLKQWEDLKKQYKWICPCCKEKEPKIQLTEDHIIPISKNGLDNIENIQPLCRSCNSKKYDKIIPKYKKP